MFNHLVESTKNRPDRGKRAYFFLGTAAVWMLMLLGALVAGVWMYDAQLVAEAEVIPLTFEVPGPPPLPAATSGGHHSSSPATTPTHPPQFATPEHPPIELPKAEDPVLPDFGSKKSDGPEFGLGNDPNGREGGVPGGKGTLIGSIGDGPSATPPPPPLRRDEVKAPQVVRQSEGVIRGSAIGRVTPEYPSLAKAGHISGDVVVELTISEDGRVMSARCISGHGLLQPAALSAARQWQFRPTLLNNTPVKVTGLLTFRFTM